MVQLKLLHWNILSHRNCNGFENVDDEAPMLRWRNRLKLMRQHLHQVDADIVGIVEADSLNGPYPDAFLSLIQMMSTLGYGNKSYNNG